ncbi:hypothetical protein ABZ733_08315 [Streptomyces longwoodensis]|uniref:hypothetical protein n=1 Tax=Streptomyces longwoodensis TaxID=68231 RepID=UPI0033EC18DE
MTQPEHDRTVADDSCRPVEVDGETIRVRGSGDWTEQDAEFFGEIVRAAKRKYAAGKDYSPAASCRRMETRACPPSYNGPCGDQPCARFESDDPTPWLAEAPAADVNTARRRAGLPPHPTADEEQQRTTRRSSIRDLLDRLEYGLLLAGEKAVLRQHVEAEIRDTDTALRRADQAEDLLRVAHETSNQSEAERASAAQRLEEHRRLAAHRLAELEQAQAAIKRVRALASRWGVLRAYGNAATELRRALDGAEQHTTEGN